MSDDSKEGSSVTNSPDKGRRLRRPLPTTQERLNSGELDTELITSSTMKSRLSADAPVFIPKFATAVTAPIQPEAVTQDALYQDFQRLVSVRPSHLSAVPTQGPASKEDVNEVFKDSVFRLTSNPGPTEEYVKRAVELLNHSTDMAVINGIIETLFEQSITEANFRFTGAKIYNLLSSSLKTHPVFSGFRGMYLNRCRKEFDERELLLTNNLDRLCGLSMYFGELFLALEIEVDGVMKKVGLLRQAIADLLTTLLSQLNDVTVKCATQLLKLTGTALMETTDLQGNFDDIFANIKTLEKHPQLNKTSHCLVNSVLSRLEYNFGVGQQVSPQKPHQSPNVSCNSSFNNEPTFYNAQGQPITREEAGFYGDDSDMDGLNSEEQEAFLQWEAENFANQEQWSAEQGGDGQWAGGWSTGMSDYTQWSTDQDQQYAYEDADYYPDYNPDMDDEMAAAYEMFLKETGQSRH